MTRLPMTTLTLSLLLTAGAVAAGGLEPLLTPYRAAGAGAPDPARGENLWIKTFATEGEQRACTSCHGTDQRRPGRQANTGKEIAPMSPAVNPERLRDPAKVEKWFTRNCKWTLGRECTPQEKSDFLGYLAAQ
jgi:hypothetical protein